MWVQLRDKLSTSCWILFDTDISFPGALRVFVCPKHESIRHSNASIPLAYYMHLVLTHSHIVCRMWSWVPRPGLPCQLLGCPYKLTVYDSIDPQYCVTISWIGKNSWANNVLFQCIQNVLASEAFFWYQHFVFHWNTTIYLKIIVNLRLCWVIGSIDTSHDLLGQSLLLFAALDSSLPGVLVNAVQNIRCTVLM